MPKEQRKRGRRAEKKRKVEAEDAATAAKLEASDSGVAIGDGFVEDYNGGGFLGDETVTFYGLLTDDEQEYFKRADEILDLNRFGDEDEKSLFIQSLWKEASGKELKIAHSQGCSRLLERLILLSSLSQLKGLFQVFSGHFLNVVKHRFASHVCETLIVEAAPWVSKEMDSTCAMPDGMTDGDVFASMESLFLYMVNELEPELNSLIVHTFASHTIRTLLLILSGRSVSSATSLIQSRKKENIPLNSEHGSKEEAGAVSVVPQEFHEAVGKILTSINNSHTTAMLRLLAVDRIGSPTLQIVLQLEMGLSHKDRKSREKSGGTLLRKLTGIGRKEGSHKVEGGADNEGDGEEENFFSNLLYDSVGSHLAESMVRYTSRKDFNTLYERFVKARVGSLARNETAAFVVQRVLEKLKKDQLEEAVQDILPQVHGLVERSRVAVLKTLIDSCIEQGVNATGVVKAVTAAYSCDSSNLIFEMLHITLDDLKARPVEEDGGQQKVISKPKRDPNQLHGSLLAQTILSLPPDFCAPIVDSTLSQSPDTIIALSKHPQASHVIQKLLNSPHTTIPTRRKFLNHLKGRFAEIALDTVGSHIVDECWNSPMNYRQSIAEELLRAEPEMRDSYSGRAVWRNWSMDKFKTRRQQWFNIGKGDGDAQNIGGGGGNKGRERTKTAIELARERHAAGKAYGFGTGANSASKRAARGVEKGGSKKQRVR